MSHLQGQPDVRPVEEAKHPEVPAVLATPADMLEPYDAQTSFWLPDWKQSLRLLGWRWIYVVGLAILVAFLAWVLMFRGRFLILSFSGLIVKGIIFMVAGAVSLLVYLRKGAIRLRTDPFCIHCGYSLEGHQDGAICPECGLRASFRVCDEYRRDPHWFIERYRKRAHVVSPGVALDVPAPSQIATSRGISDAERDEPV